MICIYCYRYCRYGPHRLTRRNAWRAARICRLIDARTSSGVRLHRGVSYADPFFRPFPTYAHRRRRRFLP